jgi:hypothetical protein
MEMKTFAMSSRPKRIPAWSVISRPCWPSWSRYSLTSGYSRARPERGLRLAGQRHVEVELGGVGDVAVQFTAREPFVRPPMTENAPEPKPIQSSFIW